MEDQVFERAASLTYRLLLAFFPFLIFLMSLVGFFSLDAEAIFGTLNAAFPEDIAMLITNFVYEMGERSNAGILSTALFFSVYNSTNGFRFIMRTLNGAYDVGENRNFFVQVGLGLLLVIIFSVMLVVMIGLMVFGQQIWGLIFPVGTEFLFGFITDISALVALALMTMLIYRLSCAKKVPIRHLLPGAIFTVSAWAIVSRVFGFAITNFTQYSAIYGSIAGVFILILWLNLVAMIMLIGNEVNAVLSEYYPRKSCKEPKRRRVKRH